MSARNGTNRKRTALFRFSYLVPILTVVSMLNAGIAGIGQEIIGEQPAPTESTTPTPTDSATPAPTDSATPEPAPTESTSPDPVPTDPATPPSTQTTPETEPSTTETTPPEQAPPAETAVESPSYQPTISSDKPDYFAGETVTLTGTNWQPAEPVHIVVNDDAGQTWRYENDVTADPGGSFTDTFTLPTHFIALYTVTATGPLSGTATTTFTDAPIQVDYKHWLDGSMNWANTTIQQSNSAYEEGEIVPHYFEAKNLASGSSYAYKIYFDYFYTTKNTCGFVDIDPYNTDRTTTFVDSVTPTPDASNPDFYTAGADVTGQSGLTSDPSKPLQQYVEVTFTATATTARFYFGLELAFPGSIGNCLGARAWPGASLQTNIADGSSGPGLGGGGTLQVNPKSIGTVIDLGVVKSDSPDPVLPGATLTYTLTVSNAGPGTATDVVVTDTLPAFTTFVSASPASADCQASGGVVTCDGTNTDPINIIPGSPLAITITVTVANNAPTAGTVQTGPCSQNSDRTSATAGVDLCNLVSVTTSTTGQIESDPSNNSDSEPTNVSFNAAIDIEKTPDTQTVSPGGTANFTITVTNTGDVSLSNVEVTDALAPNCASSSIGTLTAGQSTSYDCSLANVTADFTNSATATGTPPSGPNVSDTDTADVAVNFPPDIEVTKTASDNSVPETGQNVTFTFQIDNPGVEDVDITTLNDDQFGDLLGQGTCPASIFIPAGGSTSCEITVFLASDSLTDHVNTVTAVGTDDDGSTDTDTDSETVSFTDVLPNVTISKTADPTSVPEGGMTNVTFTIVVTNNSLEDATIDSLSDTDFDLSTHCPDAVGTVLGTSESYTCTFTAPIGGNVGADHEDTATVTASDNDGNADTESDSASVTITNVVPAITVTKSASPNTVDANRGGGNVTFTVTVTNDSVESDPVTITAVADEIWYDVNGNGTEDPGEVTTIDITNPGDPNLVNTTCNTLVGTVIQPGDTESCTFTVHVDGNPWEDPVDTVTVDVEDDEQTLTSGSDTAVVDIVDQRQPSIAVSALTASRSGDKKTVSGRFLVTNEADDPIDVLLKSVSMTFQQKVGNKWTPISSGFTCSFWLDDGDGVKDAGDTMFDPTNPGVTIGPFGSVTILYSCTRTTAWPNQLRITAHVTIFGRPGVDFRFTGTFTF